ncbi:Uncharacterised protein [uncultured archaeon]|nr:Uncharacterised protein [uncultured archaeon]
MVGKKLLFAFAVLAVFPLASAGLFYNGGIEAVLDSNSVAAGSSLTGKFFVYNFEQVAFNDAYIVAEIISGGQGTIGYPSQAGDAGNIIIESKFGANLLPGDRREIPFEISLPEGLAPGKYSLDYYYLANRSYVSGIPHIFASPKESEFIVGRAGGAGDFPQVSIVRTKTVFNGTAGPVGPPVQPEGSIAGKVFIKNSGNAAQNGLVVWAGLCNWDDTACVKYAGGPGPSQRFLSEESANESLAAGEEKEVDLGLKGPKLPGAYAIRIEVRDGSGRVVSLYRNRAIVTGGTARIKRMEISSQELEQGKGVLLGVLLGSSPDHYTNPDFSDFDVLAWVELPSGKKLAEARRHFDILRAEDAETQLAFDLQPDAGADSFRVCSSAVKGGTEMDRYCFDVSPLERGFVAGGGKIAIAHSYSPAKSELGIDVCGFGPKGEPEEVDIGVAVVDFQAGVALADTRAAGQQCYSGNFRVEPKKYLLSVNDFRNNEAHTEELDFSPRQLTCAEKGGAECPAGECNGGFAAPLPDGSFCCIGTCATAGMGAGSIEATGQAGNSYFWNEKLALIGALGVILLVAGLLMASWSRKRGEGNYGEGAE